ncbi:MAG TPA: SCO family protein [Burkholderiaceae bacterium]
MQRRSALQSIAGGALVASTAALVAACSPNKPQFSSIDLTGADYAKDFQLPDQDGRVRSLQDFRGKVVVLFFGYTQCPDVCPTTMTDLAQTRKLLGPDGDKLQVLFVTVDPERDTPQVLKGYMANFDPSFIALRGSPEQLAATARDFKVFYKKVEGKTPTSYSMDHSAASYVYDTKGQLRLYTRYGSGAQALASDIKLLLQS